MVIMIPFSSHRQNCHVFQQEILVSVNLHLRLFLEWGIILTHTRPKTDIAPANGCLENDFLLGWPFFWGYVSFRGCVSYAIRISTNRPGQWNQYTWTGRNTVCWWIQVVQRSVQMWDGHLESHMKIRLNGHLSQKTQVFDTCPKPIIGPFPVFSNGRPVWTAPAS